MRRPLASSTPSPATPSLCVLAFVLSAAACGTNADGSASSAKPTEGAAPSAHSTAKPTASANASSSASSAPSASASAAAAVGPFDLFTGAPPALKPTKRSGEWSYKSSAPILPGWENFGWNVVQRTDRQAFFLLWNINATTFDAKKLATNAKLVPMRATASKIVETRRDRTVGKVAAAATGVGELTIDGEPATVWFVEQIVGEKEMGAAADHLVWAFVAKNAAPESVRDEGRHLLRSLEPLRYSAP
jgi:hypothetical protein